MEKDGLTTRPIASAIYLPPLSGEDIYKFSVEVLVDSYSKEDPLLVDPQHISTKIVTTLDEYKACYGILSWQFIGSTQC